MKLRKFTADIVEQSSTRVPTYNDHVLLVLRAGKAQAFEEHFTGLGLIAMLTGSARLKVNGQATTIDTQSFMVVNRGSRLSFRLLSDDYQMAMLYFDPTLSSILSASIFVPRKAFRSDEEKPQGRFELIEHVHFANANLREHIQWLIKLGNSCASFHSLKADMLVRSILDAIVAENHEAIRASTQLDVVKSVTRVGLYRKLAVAREWMISHAGELIDLEQAAAMAMLNKQHFLRLFKKAYGQTPHQFLTQVRLVEASRLLERSELPVAEVAERVGFASVPSFGLLFRRKTGQSPAAYRRLLKAGKILHFR